MKALIPLLAVVIVSLAGCGESEPAIPQNAYRIEVEDLVHSKGRMLIKRLQITAHDKRIIRIGVGDGNHDTATVRPDRQSGSDMISAEIIFVADLIDAGESESKSLRWLVQIKAPGLTMGGPGLYPVPSTKTLEEAVSLNVQTSTHAIGEPLVLGQLLGEEILLTVE